MRQAPIGRSHELAAVDDLLAQIERGPSALVFEGQPGIGKTRLWQEGVERARERGFRILLARPGGSEVQFAFAGLADLLSHTLDDVLLALTPPQRRSLEAALLLDEPTGPSDDYAVAAAFLNSLRILANGDPVLVAIDDAQWLDASSLVALVFALRRLEEERIGMLATVRVEPGATVAGFPLGPKGELSERRELAPLTLAALYELVRERCELSLARPTLIRLHELSGGNPFFAIELARGLSENDELTVPGELSELLHKRLSSLSEPTQEVLLATAALSRSTREALSQVDADVSGAVAEASAADIVTEERGVIRFTHPLLASVHYSRATPAERRAVHARLAQTNLDPEERVHHRALAAEGPDEDTALALDDAVRLASARGGLASAVVLAELALTLTPPGSTGAHGRVLTAADLRFSIGDRAHAESLLATALERAADDHERAELHLKQAILAYERDQTASRKLFLLALEHAGNDARLRVDALGWLAGGFWASEPEEALGYAEAAVRFADRDGDPLVLAIALGALAHTRYMLSGEIETEVYERAIALAQSTGDVKETAEAWGEYAGTLLDSWELDRGREILEWLVDQARTRDDSEVTGRLEQLAFIELFAGNLDRAAELASEAVAVAEQGGRLNSEMYALFRLGWIEALRGDVEAARELCARSERIAEQSSGFVRGARLTLGYLESALGNHDAAWRYLDPANPLTGTMPPGRPVLHVAESVEVLAALGRSDEARAMLEPFAERAEALDRVWAIALTAHCRSLICAAEGDLDGAERAALRAIALTEANGWPLQLGRALLALGSAKRRRRRKAEARAALEQAVAVFDGMGAAIWLERARRELRRIGGRKTPAGRELSETEARIVELVAVGRSNKEVASALHLSPKTVEWNLSKIYRKLGIHSRTELAARRSTEEQGASPGTSPVGRIADPP